MLTICIVAEESKAVRELSSALTEEGFACSTVFSSDRVIERINEQSPDLLLIELDGHPRSSSLCRSVKEKRNLPIIALAHQDMLPRLDGHLPDIDDFVIQPCDTDELVVRVKRQLQKGIDRDNDEQIRHGDLTIDLASYEVSVNERRVELTFREYELLKFLASNPGRVFTRDTLLDRVWGYDYYGGDRTVDVHIRRLRSKIEDSSHVLIETIRSIGYRFKKDT